MDFVFKHKLAFMTTVKDEGIYLKEWIDYHSLLGVTKFYIYDNESSDNINEVLRPYIDTGTVEYCYWPGKGQQMAALNDALMRHRFEHKYMAFTDVDEFILPLKNERLLDIIDDIMTKADFNGGGVGINCKSFGSSGHIKRPAGNVLDNYLHRAPDGYDWTDLPWKWDAHMKTIVNPRTVACYTSPHFATHYWDKHSFDENIKRVVGMDNFVDKVERIRINHYFTKSQEDWLLKRNKGLVAMADTYRPMEEFFWRDKNDVYDDAIVRYRDSLLQNKTEQPPTNSAEDIPSVELLNKFLTLLREHPSPEDWKGETEMLLCYWALANKRRKNTASAVDKLLEEVILEAVLKSISGQTIVPYQAELVFSLWNDFAKINDDTTRQIQHKSLELMKALYEILKSRNQTDGVQHFSDALINWLWDKHNKGEFSE